MQRLAAVRLLTVCVLILLSAAFARSDRRIQLAPHFVPGATLRYRIETRTTSNEHTTTPVLDTPGGGQFNQTTNFLVRLDVLGVDGAAQGAGSSVRFRATFEGSHSDSATDTVALGESSLDDAVDKLEGHSFEFTVGPDKQLANITGLEEIASNRGAVDRALSWITVLSDAGAIPRDGIAIGQKWSGEKTLTGLPLADIVWRTESSYLHDEPCAAAPAISNASDSRSAAPSGQTCAVILTHFEMSRRGSEHSDATPDDYRRNGLRTSGRWTGSGESLNSISLASGFLVSSTQTATQDMDYEIVSASSGSRIHNAGRTTTETEITLVAEPSGSKS